MPATIQNVVNSANTQWSRWGGAVWNTVANTINDGFHTDDENAFATIVRDEYCALVIPKRADRPTKQQIAKDKYFWSAVGMSFIMSEAGYTKAEFKFSQAHRDFIRQAIKARRNNVATASFWGFRIDEAGSEPAVGDLVGYARGDGVSHAKAQTFFDDMTTSYGSHTDVVVATRPGEIEVIGANVQDSVAKKIVRVGSTGRLTDTVHPWFVVMKRR
jgi:hypothetical protein